MSKRMILNGRLGVLAMLVAGFATAISTTTSANWGGGYGGENEWHPRWKPKNVFICNVQWWQRQPASRTVWMDRNVAENLSSRWPRSWVIGKCQDKIPVCHIMPNGKTQTTYLPIAQAYRRVNLWPDRWALGKCQGVISPY